MGWSLGLLANDTVSAMIISIAHSVYNVLQKQVVSFKESKSSQIDEDDEQDPVAEALVFTDNASLHRMGGFVLHSAIKISLKSDLNFLTSLGLPKEDKESLPINLKVLDKGGLTFMKQEMIG